MSPGEYSPPKKMIEFSRKQQEQKIVHDIKEEVDHLKRDQVDLEVWILQLLKLMVYAKKKNQRRVLFIFNLIFFSFYWRWFYVNNNTGFPIIVKSQRKNVKTTSM